jgi:dihydroneopterin aldolase/2-amino-4-hydroxy-6-hydroxymethyldihydropteridine diphosphokinase
MRGTDGDRIVLRGVWGTGYHGVFDHEKRDGQVFVVDVELEVDLQRAGESDDLAQTVNYGEIGADVLRRIEGEPFDLIERLAEVIAQDCLAHPLVEAVTVHVHKPQAPVGVEFSDVEVVVHRERELSEVVIAIGANLADPVRTVRSAIRRLRRIGLHDVRASGLFETDPVGGPEQPPFVNAVVVARTRLAPAHLLRRLHQLEAEAGRVRDVRWGPRTLDLDLIQYGTPGEDCEVRSDDDDLSLPHPRAHERAFVLVPWLDADPAATLRVGAQVRAVAELVATLDVTGVRGIPTPERGRKLR